MKTKRILSVLLAAGMLFSLAACKKKGGSDGSTDTFGDGAYTDYVTHGPVEGTIHERSIGFTDKKLMENGATDYQIVISKDAGATISKAVNEFNSLFGEATGIVLSVITDESITYDENSKYISLGKTSLLEKAGLNVDFSVLGPQGYELVTKGSSIFVAGDELGTMYGVYDMLETLVGYEIYTVEYYRLLKNVKDVVLPNFDVREVPDFLYRKSPNGSYQATSQIADRMRVLNEEYWIKGVSTHTVFNNFLPQEQYANAHPKWFNASLDQFCYTARGDAAEYEALVEIMVEKSKEYIISDPEHDHIGITQEDNTSWCSCDTCKALIRANGNCNSATQIKFVNDVAERVEAWLASDEAGEHKGRKVTFVFFAYNATFHSPAVKNADGTYSPISSEMRCRDNVGVWIAAIGTNFTQSVYASVNTEYREAVYGWAACTDNILVWDYDCHFREYLVPYDSWNGMQDRLRFYYDLGAYSYWSQGEWNATAHTGFGDLKSFLWSKLMWNVNVDVNALIDEFFAEVYREAAGAMKDAYWQMRAELLRHRVEENANGYVMDDTSKYYKKQYLVNLVNTMESARKQVAKYADTDAEYFKLVSKYITKETISPNYMLLKRYADTYSSEELTAFIAKFTEDLAIAGISKSDEQSHISGFLNGLKALV